MKVMKSFMKPFTCYKGIILLRKICSRKPFKHKFDYVLFVDELLTNSVYQQLLITESSKSVLKEVTTKHLPVIRHLAEIDVSEDQCRQLLDALEALTTYAQSSCLLLKLIFENSFCYLEGDPVEPHTQNQKILYNIGKLIILINIHIEFLAYIQEC